MNRNKYQKLTANNIHRVADALRKMGAFNHYQSYPSANTEANVVKVHGIVSKSMLGLDTYIKRSYGTLFNPLRGRVEVDELYGDRFIRIVYSEGIGGLIYEGAKFRLTPNRLYVIDTKDRCWPIGRPCEAFPKQVFAKC